MRIAITGATGLVGTRLTPALTEAGHQIVRLVRSPTASHPGNEVSTNSGSVGSRGTDRAHTAQSNTAKSSSAQSSSAQWDPDTGAVDLTALGDIDAVVHLAGEGVANGRWTAARKQRIADSRGPATDRLCRTLAGLPQPPRILISASAIGIYGNRGDEELHEGSSLDSGNDFLATVAAAWEEGTAPLVERGTRVVRLRIGVVLDRRGGALAKMLLPFRLGIGGRIGDGNHWMSWITLHDLVRVILHVLDDETMQGPVLAIAPTPVRNRVFTHAMGKVLRRPTVLPVPYFLLRLLFGEMASMVVGSQHARPFRLLESGFTFDHASIDSALRALLRDHR